VVCIGKVPTITIEDASQLSEMVRSSILPDRCMKSILEIVDKKVIDHLQFIEQEHNIMRKLTAWHMGTMCTSPPAQPSRPARFCKKRCRVGGPAGWIRAASFGKSGRPSWLRGRAFPHIYSYLYIPCYSISPIMYMYIYIYIYIYIHIYTPTHFLGVFVVHGANIKD
jgi:hypothetical protein